MRMIKRGLVAGIVNLILGIGLMLLFGQVFPTLAGEYKNSAIFRPWTDPLMQAYFAYPFILGIVAAYLWDKTEKQFKAKTPTSKALEFAKLYFVIATIPGMFISYTSFQVSGMMIGTWTITGFVQALGAGWVFAKIK